MDTLTSAMATASAAATLSGQPLAAVFQNQNARMIYGMPPGMIPAGGMMPQMAAFGHGMYHTTMPMSTAAGTSPAGTNPANPILGMASLGGMQSDYQMISPCGMMQMRPLQMQQQTYAAQSTQGNTTTSATTTAPTTTSSTRQRSTVDLPNGKRFKSGLSKKKGAAAATKAATMSTKRAAGDSPAEGTMDAGTDSDSDTESDLDDSSRKSTTETASRTTATPATTAAATTTTATDIVTAAAIQPHMGMAQWMQPTSWMPVAGPVPGGMMAGVPPAMMQAFQQQQQQQQMMGNMQPWNIAPMPHLMHNGGGLVQDLPLRRAKKRRGHVCQYCSKVLETKYKLERHVRTHTGERPFHCQQCPAKFNQKSSLKTHSNIHAREVVKDPPRRRRPADVQD